VLSARIALRFGTKATIALGIMIAPGPVLPLRDCRGRHSYGMVVIGMCCTSLGMGLTMSPATNSVMGSLPVDKAGIGSAMNDTTGCWGRPWHRGAGTIMNGIYIDQIDAGWGRSLNRSWRRRAAAYRARTSSPEGGLREIRASTRRWPAR